MSTKDNLILEPHSPLRQAQRFLEIGGIFLDLDPDSQQTGMASDIFHMSTTEDMKFPVIIQPRNDTEVQMQEAALAANARADAMPSSIQNNTVYSIERIEDKGIALVSRTQRVDLGYKIPEIGFDTGSEEGDMQAAAAFLTDRVINLQGRTEEERRADQWDNTLRATVLADYTNQVVIDPLAIEAGQITVVQQDNMSGLSNVVVIDLNQAELSDKITSGFFGSVEFNLLSTLQQKVYEADEKMAARIRAVVNDFIGK